MQNEFLLTPYFLDEPRPGLDSLAESGWQLNEPTLQLGSKQERMTALYKPLRDMVTNTVKMGDRPVSIAGDCCTSLAVMAGLQQAGLKPTLLWLDAHGDFNTWETTPSGFLGGMPLAMLVGQGEQTIVNGVGLTVVPEDQVVLTDARDLDPEERIAVERSAVLHIPDATHLMHEQLPGGPLYIHFDTDIIDPKDAPAMSYLAAGGPSADTLSEIFKHLKQSNQIVAVSVSAWNPDLDVDGRSQEIVMKLVADLCQ